jgi:hypothetical protein
MVDRGITIYHQHNRIELMFPGRSKRILYGYLRHINGPYHSTWVATQVYGVIRSIYGHKLAVFSSFTH